MSTQSTKKRPEPKIVVIGGGTGLPVILKALRSYQADITAVVTVADDGGSSGIIRDYINVVPPGDIRNVLIALSDVPELVQDVFQYRFESKDKFFSGHAIGNLIIAALTEMNGNNIFKAVQELAQLMNVHGNVYPVANYPLILNAEFKDGTTMSGESKIAKANKDIQRVWVTNTKGEKAYGMPQVLEAIMEADQIVLGPGSLFTSILPNLMIENVAKALCETSAEIVYICNIMTQKGETEHLTDAQHVKILNQHLKQKSIDTVLVNTAPIPENYLDQRRYDEYLLQVQHDFAGLRAEECRVISDDFLLLKDGGVFHNGCQVAAELFKLIGQPIEAKSCRNI